ncbi:uncharacterized protein LOC142907498 [Petromyzon marinus]|uniref:uncharacterized protein LOC142907498 n=1 Tax=Petromyzon marinus TaxID=7757 RepID=UPI003F70AC77
MVLLIVGVLLLAMLGMEIFIYRRFKLSISDFYRETTTLQTERMGLQNVELCQKNKTMEVEKDDFDHETTTLSTERMGLQNVELCQKSKMLRLELQHQLEEFMENRETLQREIRSLFQQLKERQLELEPTRVPCRESKSLHADFLRDCNAAQRQMSLRCENEDLRRSLHAHLRKLNFLNPQRGQEQFRLRGKLVRHEDMWHGEKRLQEENLHLRSQLKELIWTVSQMYNDTTTTDATSTAAATASTTATVSTTTSATTTKPKKMKRFSHWFRKLLKRKSAI